MERLFKILADVFLFDYASREGDLVQLTLRLSPTFLYQASTIDRAGDPGSGQRMFNEKGCVLCHSVGRTGGQKAPELSKIAANSDSNAWTSAMLNHAGSMIAPITNALGQWPQFAGNEMNDLIATCVRLLHSTLRTDGNYLAMQSVGGMYFSPDAFSAILCAERVDGCVPSWGRTLIFHSPQDGLPACFGTMPQT